MRKSKTSNIKKTGELQFYGILINKLSATSLVTNHLVDEF